ncbi:PIN domain-containing protein [Cobetia marina]|uniref:PIN-like domain-containing protein n=1 Tax=Cobetia marina TaxID=28258 RepID=UPI0026E31D7A|nr:PIN domain-containing protein [Cobetia marina]MDO6786044.1 PIN domain-containing protein [Cobetia marina]
MKNLFPGHFKPTEESVKRDWEDFVFVFDTNVLLNIYRYSESTRLEYLGLLDKIKERSWLPNRVVEEYLNNRLSTIAQQEKAYNTMLNSINSLKQELDNSRQHPFASKETMTSVNEAFNKLTTEFTDNKNSYTSKIHDDDIKDRYFNIYNNRVGDPISSKILETIFTEGEERYKNQIPPGYKDASKQAKEGTPDDLKRKFGDLIIWKEIIQHSSSIDKGIIFVTDDRKEDWWEIFNGKTIGPRPELIKEFEKNTGNRIHIYKSDRFLELARKNLGQQVSTSIVDEIRDSNSHEANKHHYINIDDLSYEEIFNNETLGYTEDEYKNLLNMNIDHEDLPNNELDKEVYSNAFNLFEKRSIDNRIELLLMELKKETRKKRDLDWQRKSIEHSNNKIEQKYHDDRVKDLVKITNKDQLKNIEHQSAMIKGKILNLNQELKMLRSMKSNLDII